MLLDVQQHPVDSRHSDVGANRRWLRILGSELRFPEFDSNSYFEVISLAGIDVYDLKERIGKTKALLPGRDNVKGGTRPGRDEVSWQRSTIKRSGWSSSRVVIAGDRA